MRLSKRKARVFLIYAHGDKKDVHNLYTRLVRDGMAAWLDAENLLPGQEWEYEIRKAILKSDVVIVCLSQAFKKQQGYRHEETKGRVLEKANLLSKGEIFIIPARLEKCAMPESLRHLHRVDLFEDGGYKKLIRTLRKYVSEK